MEINSLKLHTKKLSFCIACSLIFLFLICIGTKYQDLLCDINVSQISKIELYYTTTTPGINGGTSQIGITTVDQGEFIEIMETLSEYKFRTAIIPDKIAESYSEITNEVILNILYTKLHNVQSSYSLQIMSYGDLSVYVDDNRYYHCTLGAIGKRQNKYFYEILKQKFDSKANSGEWLTIK